MTVNELIAALAAEAQQYGDSEVQATIYNPHGAPVFGPIDDVVTDGEGTVFISVPSTDAN